MLATRSLLSSLSHWTPRKKNKFLHEKYRELAAAGVEFSGEPEKQFWGGILATLRDPAGNELQIVQQPTA
jgi:uncharacterized glyoxalase superfamily protein PhnB